MLSVCKYFQCHRNALKFDYFEKIIGNVSYNVDVYTVVLFFIKLLLSCEHCATMYSATILCQIQKQSFLLIEQRL